MDSKLLLVLILIAAALCYPLYRYASCGLTITYRSDGDFRHLPMDTAALASFFSRTGMKPIDLSTVTTDTYTLTINGSRTITIPPGYVSDGVSKPFRCLPLPYNREGHYWVYHDWMYQKQSFDDGTPISKEAADDIMNLLVFSEKETITHPYKLLYRLFVQFYKHGDAEYRQALKERGVAFLRGGGVCFSQ